MGSVAKQLVALCILVLMTNAVSAQSEKSLASVFDSSKNETTFFVSPMMEVKRSDPSTQKILDRDTVEPKNIPFDYLRMVVYYKAKGRSAQAKPDTVVIAIESATFSNFKFRQYRDLKVKTDGEEIDLGEMSITAQRSNLHNVIGVRFWETLELPIKSTDYKKIIASKRVKMQLGDTSFGLLKDQLKTLRAIASEHLD
jgi:hypothetical protein